MRRPAEPSAATAWMLALVAAGLDVAVPLLPIYGTGNQFIFASYPARFAVYFLLGEWASAIVIAVGVGLLARSRTGIATGVFLAMGIELLLSVGAQVAFAGLRGWTWQTVIVHAMRSAEGILLLFAAASAWKTHTHDRPTTKLERPTGVS
jgi:hypothetical protein